MVAQDLVVSKQPEAIHTHALPFVHGSGAIGLKTINLHTYGLGSLDSKPCTVTDTFEQQPWRGKEHQQDSTQPRAMCP